MKFIKVKMKQGQFGKDWLRTEDDHYYLSEGAERANNYIKINFFKKLSLSLQLIYFLDKPISKFSVLSRKFEIMD